MLMRVSEREWGEWHTHESSDLHWRLRCCLLTGSVQSYILLILLCRFPRNAVFISIYPQRERERAVSGSYTTIHWGSNHRSLRGCWTGPFTGEDRRNTDGKHESCKAKFSWDLINHCLLSTHTLSHTLPLSFH